MKKTQKMLAVMLATLMIANPMQALAITGNTTTDTLNFNQDGNQGQVVYTADVTADMQGETFGLRLSDFVGGEEGRMATVNVAVAFDGVVDSFRMGAREGQVISFTVPADATTFSVIASTNESNTNRVSGFGLDVVAIAEGTDNFTAGTFTGTASNGGFYGDGNISVSVTVSENAILDITVLEHFDTENFFQRANQGLPESIVFAQSTDVDVVTGATTSSTGILEAVRDALSQARVAETVVEETETEDALEVEEADMLEVEDTDVVETEEVEAEEELEDETEVEDSEEDLEDEAEETEEDSEEETEESADDSEELEEEVESTEE